MTNEEAIVYLERADTTVYKKIKTKTAEALEMAIKALEQQLRDCKTCKHSDNGNCAGSEECHECMWESKYEQQPSEPRTNLAETSQDCISIEPIQWYSQNKDGYLVKGAYSKDEAYVKLTDVYEKIRISEDCISREEVQDLISIWLSDYLLDETREALETINYKVGDMPAVYPERPKGKWIEVLEWRTEFGSAWHYECSECRARSYKGFKPLERYCPNCGAEMEGGKDENNFGR